VSVRKDAATVGAATAATGSAVTAAVAATCCVGPSIAPLLLPVLGASGLIAIAALRPYMIWLEVTTALLLTFSFWQIYRRRTTCGKATAPVPTSLRVARIATWTAAGLWLLSLLYAFYGVTHESASADAGYEVLSDNGEPVRAAFNRAASGVRIVVLVSPT
jgi:hypothetical protein